MSSVPQTYTISDFIEWNRKKQLVLQPDFQRGSVWSPQAKVFLIDTILNDLPMPQIFFRTKIDPSQQSTIREVVDGQQRLRTILEFASGKIRLTSKAPNFKDKTYVDLDIEDQERFLSYKVPVVQLINSTDSDVLEVFARLNSYSVKVTPPELRHAQYSEPVKWAIYEATRDWSNLWNEYGVVSLRDSVRLKNTSVMAEMFMILDTGFNDAGEANITKYYELRKNNDEKFFQGIRKKVDKIVTEILEEMGEDFSETTFFDAPNFLALFAAVAYLKGDLPVGRVTEGLTIPPQPIDWAKASDILAAIAQDVDDGEENRVYSAFVSATASTTHRVASRKVRFQTLVGALAKNAS
ncbi:GmrSD restriction endonuclease domain-containing protein [Agrobacterium tumefaciens]|uniref:GmrSD restriction endonuclease domain-containing protein n=1 Tax=Agrobacterium tumefaciens TaxID=358 RepID=UPI0015737BDA|nr:DUF262 domain-containing protein [Agrobacterium tumefaciens]